MEQAYSLVHQALEAAVKEELVFCQIRCYDLLCNFALKEEKWQQAFTFAQKGQMQIEEHEDSIRMESSHGSRYLIQAYCSEKLGDRAEASQLYQKGLQLSLLGDIYDEAAEAIIRLLFGSMDWDD